MPKLFGAKHWRERAEEARTLADQMNDGDARRSMLTIAAEYDKLAVRAENRAEIETQKAKGEPREG
jgi:hypothetical protein